jgi:hypothetical protein
MHICMTNALCMTRIDPAGQARVKDLDLTRLAGPRFLTRPDPSAGRVSGTAGSTRPDGHPNNDYSQSKISCYRLV